MSASAIINKTLISAFLFLISCCSQNKDDKDDDFDIYEKKISHEFLKKEKNLLCIGTGLRVPEDKILYFSFIFLVKGNPSIEKARALIVQIMQDFAELAANDPDSSKFLIKSPDSIANGSFV